MPIDSAASHWPFGMERTDARTASDAYAPVLREKAIIAALHVEN